MRTILFCSVLILSNLSGKLFSQCSVAFHSYTSNFVSQSGSNCTYTFTAKLSKSNGNPSAQLQYGCSSSANTPPATFTNFSGNSGCFAISSDTIFATSPQFVCPCGTIPWANVEGWTNGSCGGGDCPPISGAVFPLPLSLINFKNTLLSNQTCTQWTVAEETNTLNYYIEGSADGKLFTVISEAKASGNLEYEICMPIQRSISFYRLKIIERDGSYYYSHIIRSSMANRNLTFYPNPITHFLNIDINKDDLPTEGIHYKIINTQGQLMYSGHSPKPQINLDKLPAGMFIFEWTNSFQGPVQKSFFKVN